MPRTCRRCCRPDCRGSAEIAYDDGRSEFAFSGPDGEVSGQTVSSSGLLSFELSPETFGYEIGVANVAYAATLPDLPFPVTAEMRELKLDLSVPVAKSEEPQPFSMGFALRDLAISDTIWSMIDPQEALPRDPATLALRLSGTATPYAMLFDPDAMARIEQSGGQPGEINSVEIDELNMSALGAELTGDGSFTFDNSDTETFDGMPAPSGSVELTLSGAEAVIDTLVSMGIIGENDAMGARMMLSMFSVPGRARIRSLRPSRSPKTVTSGRMASVSAEPPAQRMSSGRSPVSPAASRMKARRRPGIA